MTKPKTKRKNPPGEIVYESENPWGTSYTCYAEFSRQVWTTGEGARLFGSGKIAIFEEDAAGTLAEDTCGAARVYELEVNGLIDIGLAKKLAAVVVEQLHETV